MSHLREMREKAGQIRQTKCSSQMKRPRKSDQQLFPFQKPDCENSQNPLFASSEPTKRKDALFCPEKRSVLHRATQRAAMADAARCDGTCSRVRWHMQQGATKTRKCIFHLPICQENTAKRSPAILASQPIQMAVRCAF